MQFSIVAIVAALAATSTATPTQIHHVPANGSAAYYYPSGTVSIKPTGTGIMPTRSTLPFTGAASMPTHMAGSALGLVVAGGVALMF